MLFQCRKAKFSRDHPLIKKEKQQTNTRDKLEQLKARIQYTYDKINKLVYRLYGLSEEEIGSVEGSV